MAKQVKQMKKTAVKAKKSSKKEVVASTKKETIEILELDSDADELGLASDEDADEFEDIENLSGPRSASEGLSTVEEESTKSLIENISAASLKNFRHHPDIENFYRFVSDNDLRYEAMGILDLVLAERRASRAVKAAKKKTH